MATGSLGQGLPDAVGIALAHATGLVWIDGVASVLIGLPLLLVGLAIGFGPMMASAGSTPLEALALFMVGYTVFGLWLLAAPKGA